MRGPERRSRVGWLRHGTIAWVAMTLVTVQWTAVRFGGRVAIADLSLVAAVCGLLLLVAFDRGTRLVAPPVQVWVAVLVLVAGDVVPGGDDGDRLGVLAGLSLATCWFVLAQTHQLVPGRQWVAIDLLVWSAVASSSVAVGSALSVGRLSWPAAVEFTGREVGLATHPNQLALSSLVGLAMVLFGRAAPKMRVPTSRAAQRRTAAALVVLGAGVALSGSRAGVGCAVILVAVWGWTRRASIAERSWSPRMSWRSVAGGAATLFVAPVILAPAVTRLLGLTDFARRNVIDSDGDRSALLGRAIRDITSSPWTGVGSDHLLSAHNLVLQLLASGGLVLLLAVTPLLFLAARGAFAAVTSTPSVAVVAWLVFGMVQNPLIDRSVHIVVMLAVVTWISRELVGGRISADQLTNERSVQHVADVVGSRTISPLHSSDHRGELGHGSAR